MSNIKNLTCIRCPMGCALRVEMNGKEVVSIEGNTCPRGAEYGKNEVTHPMRAVTSTVKAAGGIRPVVSCKTAGEVPKEKIFDVMDAIKKVNVMAPVTMGDVIVPNIAGTGVDLIATSSLPEVN